MAVFAAVIKEFNGPGDLPETQVELLETLQSLANTQTDLFRQELMLLAAGANTALDAAVPIAMIIETQSVSRAFTPTSSQDIADGVQVALKNLVGGTLSDVVQGINTLVTSWLESFFDLSSGESGLERRYFIYTSPFSICRVDIASWYQLVTASAMQSKVTQVINVAYSQAVVDVSKIQWNDLLALYEVQLADENLTPAEVASAKDELQQAWDMMGGSQSLPQDTVSEKE